MTATGTPSKWYTFFTDVHEGGPHPVDVRWDYGPNSYYLGDNVDVRWYNPKSSFTAAMRRMTYYHDRFRGRFVRGNHELNSIDAPDWIVTNGILITHGDYLFWGTKRADEYRRKVRGLNVIHRTISGFLSCIMTQLFQFPCSPGFEKRASEEARKRGCHTVVCGHWHPKRIRRFTTPDGIMVVILPRGRTDIFL